MFIEKNARFYKEYYHDTFENDHEPEGSASSGQVDVITASANSHAPLRKCMNLNSVTQHTFGLSKQVFSLSSLSSSQRKGLVLRLRFELERIRVLQKQAELYKMAGATFSSSGDILRCSNKQNRLTRESAQKSSVAASGPLKKQDAHGFKKQGWSRGTSGRFDSANQSSIPRIASFVSINQCESLLKRLMSHQFGWVFNQPVDAVKLNIPDYFTVIKHPMDLGTIKTKINSGAYSSPLDFCADVRLTFSNAMTYNPPGNDVHFMADTMSKFFEARWKSIEKKVRSLPPASDVHSEVETAKAMPPVKKRKVSPMHPESISDPIVEQIMTDEEKLNLGRELEALLGEMPMHIVDFLRQHCSNGRETGEDEIEIDIDDLSDSTLSTLRKLLDNHLQKKQKKSSEAEPCEIELLNESGLSNSLQPCEGNDPAEEYFDIGGNEASLSSYPFVEIEKASDSNGSLDGDSGCGKALDPVDASKGTLEERTFLREKLNNSDVVDGNGGNAITGRGLFSDKLYRAALLKNRFADTILNAKEKTLKQGEKRDPERLHREREELELQKRKEKARLLAEAKAAEDARRQLEAEAAAEAKRKREMEREAARQALLKMEKTVEINENSRFLEDLEMLRTAPMEQLPSSVVETTSSDNSQDGLGGLKLGGNNPLEQLGLFMKDEDEEEDLFMKDEEELLTAPSPSKDTAEGEIG